VIKGAVGNGRASSGNGRDKDCAGDGNRPSFAISFNRPNFFNITCIYLLIRLRVLLVPAGRPGSGRILHSPADRPAMKAQS